jgi:hypothetical protein
VSNINRTRREFVEMVMSDDVKQVAARMTDVLNKFCDRDGAKEALKESLGNLLGG